MTLHAILRLSPARLLGEARSARRGPGHHPRKKQRGWRAVPDHSLAPPATGILWNLSSSDHLKDRLARDTLEQLTDLVLSPFSGARGPLLTQQNASEAEIFYNATGFLRCDGQQAGEAQRRGVRI